MDILIGLLLNVLGCDLYDRCPRLARWIIRKAVARLPDDKRERYAEEWNAHLQHSDTNLDQIRHAVGSWLSVRAIRGRTPAVPTPHRIDFIITGAVMISIATVGEAAVRLHAGMPWPFLFFYLVQLVGPAIVMFAGIKLWRRHGNIVEL